MPDQGLRLTVLGTRGSMAISGADYSKFGGATSCYLVESGGRSVILDAGSGLLRAPELSREPVALMVSHWHLDHLLGLGMYARLTCPGVRTDLYVPAADDEAATRQLNRLYAPPFWPLALDGYTGDLRIHTMPRTLDLGPMHVTTTEGNHPGDCVVMRVECDGKSIVYVTDYEHEPQSFARLARFSRDADLLLYDAQYSEDEYDAHKGFGHSTPSMGIELMRAARAKRLLLIHHDPKSVDDELEQRESQLTCDNVRFAREGEVIVL